MPCGGLKICSEGVEGVISKGGGIRAPCGSPPSSTRVRVPGAFSSMPLIRAFWVEHARFFFLVFLLSYNGSGRKSYPPACTWFSCSSLSRAHTRTNTLDHIFLFHSFFPLILSISFTLPHPTRSHPGQKSIAQSKSFLLCLASLAFRVPTANKYISILTAHYLRRWHFLQNSRHSK